MLALLEAPTDAIPQGSHPRTASVLGRYDSRQRRTLHPLCVFSKWPALTGGASPAAECKRILLSIQETWIQSLGGEDPLEEEMPPTPVFLPGKFLGQRSPMGYNPWGHKEPEITEHVERALTGGYFPDLPWVPYLLFNCKDMPDFSATHEL